MKLRHRLRPYHVIWRGKKADLLLRNMWSKQAGGDHFIVTIGSHWSLSWIEYRIGIFNFSLCLIVDRP